VEKIFQRIKDLFTNFFKEQTLLHEKLLPHEIRPAILDWEVGDLLYMDSMDYDTGKKMDVFSDYKYSFECIDENYIYMMRFEWDDNCKKINQKYTKVPIWALTDIDNGSYRHRLEAMELRKAKERAEKRSNDTKEQMQISANDFYMTFIKEYKKLRKN